MWDFNVAPQMSVLSAQIDYENRKVYILEEILGKPEEKENNTPALARKVRLKLYRDKHIGGVDVTGDPSGLQRSTTNEDGINNYTIITDTFGRGILRPKVSCYASSLRRLHGASSSTRYSGAMKAGRYKSISNVANLPRI